MPIPFPGRITRQNRSKNDRATPKVSKITLMGLDAKGKKTQKSETNIFQGRHINVSVPV